MEQFSKIVKFIVDMLWDSNFLVYVIIFSGIIFTILTRGVQFRLLSHMFGLLFNRKSEISHKSKVSSFQAFCISTASRVGVGNLVGVVVAIAEGGPGAVFWMWVIAFLNSATAFMESTIAILHRTKSKNGEYRGGAPYFLEKVFKSKIMSYLFIISALICWGAVFQIISNSMTTSFETSFSINTTSSSILLVLLSGVILFGNRNKLVKVLDKLVPFMAGIYLLVVLFIILKNITLLPGVLVEIFTQALGIKQFVGGSLGSIIMIGIKRGLFSNEAGSGSAPCAAAAAEVEHPVIQGLIQALGVLVDTVLICSATAFVVLLTQDKVSSDIASMTLLQEIFKYQVGSWGVIFISLILFLFCFSTILGVSFYAKPNLYYLTEKEYPQTLFKIFTLIMLYIGGTGEENVIWNLADLGLGTMTIFNLIGVYLLSKTALKSLREYEDNYL